MIGFRCCESSVMDVELMGSLFWLPALLLCEVSVIVSPAV